ncbi:MAG: hypothetical protein LQ348_003928 [Seirophora lacunosa]|nr:MAG: hypothetical protein LQ348_003928 [Seirophora lacunosa]
MSDRSPETESSGNLTGLGNHTKAIAPSYFSIVASRSFVTPAVLNHHYAGSGTENDPYVVEFLPDDPRNPMGFSTVMKWTITILVAFVTLAVAFVSSAYSGGIVEIVRDFDTSEEVATLGISLFVCGFAIGPLLFAPLSELYGRQIVLLVTYGLLTAFNAAAAGSKNVQTLVILRFFAGAFGSSPLTNSGGVIADMFPASQRGLAMSIFAAAPFCGPVLGPIVGGFVGETVGWRWLEGVMAMFTFLLWVLGTLTIPETYAPFLLQRRAARLSRDTNSVYRSKLEIGKPKPSLAKSFKVALSRPWILLIREPIVLLLSIYLAIIYGTLYMMFGAFPIVYQRERHWTQGVGSLPFLSVLIGMLAAVVYTIPDNKRYQRAERNAISKGASGAPPEARLPPCMVGSVCLPIGLFVFAWTNSPNVHWIVSVMFTAPFGFEMVVLFLSVMNYLIDAANSVLRSLFGATFPLFTTYMYDRLGIHWASSIPAFLALACVPFPFLFYKYGPAIRMRCKYARAAVEVMERLQRQEESGENSWGKGKRSSNQPKDTEGDKEEVMANGFGAVKREKQEHDLDLEREAS